MIRGEENSQTAIGLEVGITENNYNLFNFIGNILPSDQHRTDAARQGVIENEPLNECMGNTAIFRNVSSDSGFNLIHGHRQRGKLCHYFDIQRKEAQTNGV